MKSIIKDCCAPEILEFVNYHEAKLSFDTGEIIFQEGESVKGIYSIKTGKVKVTKKTVDGDELIVRLASDGMILGHRGFNKKWKYPVSAFALSEVTVEFLPLNIFNMVAKSNAEFSYKMMMFFAEELHKTEDRVSHLQIKNRVARFIYRNYEAFGFDKEIKQKLNYTITRKDLALQAGSTYETTIRALTSLIKENVISTDGKDILIHDLKKLKILAEL